MPENTVIAPQVLRCITIQHTPICLSLSADGALAACGHENSIVTLLDTTASSFQEFVGHSESVTSVCFSTFASEREDEAVSGLPVQASLDGEYLISGSTGGELCAWKCLL
jgi:WD40 repeat protein